MFYERDIKTLTGDEFQSTCPAALPQEVTEEVQRLTVEVFRVCLCRDAARVDFRLDTRGGKLRPMILEVNAIPGMMFESDLTIEAEAEGFTHRGLVQNVFAAGCERYGLEHNVKERWACNWPPTK